MRRGSRDVAMIAAMIAASLAFGSLMTLIIPPSGAARIAPASPLHSICIAMLAGAVVSMLRGWYTVASAVSVGTLWIVALAATSALFDRAMADAMLRSVDMHSLPNAVSLIALAVGAWGCIVFLVGNGPLRPLRRACGILLILSGVLGLAGLNAFGAVVPGLDGGMSIVTATALLALGVAVHEVERDVEVAHA